MPTKDELRAEAMKRGLIKEAPQHPSIGAAGPYSTEEIQAEIERRGLRQPRPYDAEMQELAKDIGPLQAFLIGVGEGFHDIGVGLNIADPLDPVEKAGMKALHEERPIATGAGQIVGQAAPFAPAGIAAAAPRAVAGRMIGGAALGATEGGVVARGTDENVVTGALIGAGAGAAGEVLFPIVGRVGRKLYEKVFRRAPEGAMLDALGRPTQELQQALDAAGLSYEDLTQDAAQLISRQPVGAVPEQVARAARFRQEGVPATTGEITQQMAPLTTEQRLIGSSAERAAEPFRRFKLQQSEAIKANLRDAFTDETTREATGQIIQDALTGRRKLLRSQKNELYDTALEQTRELGGVHLFTDDMRGAVPLPDELEDLAITAPQAVDSVTKLLTKYGVIEPAPGMVPEGFAPTPLTLENAERFRKTLNRIERSDPTGAASVIIGPVREALDTEFNNLSDNVGNLVQRMTLDSGKVVDMASPEARKVEQLKGLSDTLKEARKRVRTLKTEFSPQSLVGRIVDTKKDGVTQITEASKVYDKIASKATPVEDVRKLAGSLIKSGDKGKEALASMQTTTMMDLIDAGFSTESRKIQGIPVFNPTAFKRRMKAVGVDKIEAMFKNEPDIVKKLKNIDKIALDLIPPGEAVPKGSAQVIMDLTNRLGLATITTKYPVLGAIGGAMVKGTVGPIKTTAQTVKALKGAPEVAVTDGAVKDIFTEIFPGIGAALGVSAAQGVTE